MRVNGDHVRKVALAAAVSLLGGCSPAVSTIVVGPGPGNAVLVETTDELSPGDDVAILHRFCFRTYTGRCTRWQVARGIVTTVVDDPPRYAFVELAPGARVYMGDRAVKKGSPMSPWHADVPPQ